MSVRRWNPSLCRLMLATCAAAVLPALAFAPAPAAAQGVDTSFAIARNGIIDISMRTGRLIVRGSNRTTAQLRSDGNDYRIRSEGVGVTLSVGPENRPRGQRSSSWRSEDVELLVPRAVKLVVHGMALDVNVDQIDGDVEVEVFSGDVELRSLGGRAIVSTLSGDIDVTSITGSLKLSTVSGDVTARDVRGDIDMGTTSGNADFSVQRVGRVEFRSTSGDLTLDGTLTDDARLQFETHSGNVELRLPGVAGRMEVSTFNGTVGGGAMTLMPGSISSGRRERSTRVYEFGGGGRTRITVSTFSGDVTLHNSGRRRSE